MPILRSEECPAFRSARPVWLAGREREMNLLAGFRAVFRAPAGARVVLRAATSGVYRAFLNGGFLGHGPARAAHGHFRVDEWDLTGRLAPGRNLLAIEVAGYNVNSYYLLDQPSFLQAEVISDGAVLASTAGRGARFAARAIEERIRKVQRYTLQRTFVEAYRLRPGGDLWRCRAGARFPSEKCAAQPPVKLLPRRVPTPDFHLRQPVAEVSAGALRPTPTPPEPWKYPKTIAIRPIFKGYREEELEANLALELKQFAAEPGTGAARPFSPGEPLKLEKGSYRILDFGTNLTGFPGLEIVARGRSRLYLTWDEVLTDGGVKADRIGCGGVNVARWELPAGRRAVETLEPYTLRYLQLSAPDGEVEVRGLHLRELAHPGNPAATFAASDERLNRIFEAARQTFRQNSVDLFMDCPSRERAGWLCDSFFTARAARDLCGDALVEKNFLENFRLAPAFGYLPKGMFPMCYPSDHPDGQFIPNWALWLVLQLEEYQERTGDRREVAALRRKVLALFDYFKPFRSSDGLLEGLKGWVFVEWSQANKFVQDVNYPSNLLYAAALEAAARLYRRPALAAEAARVREVVLRQSFDGEFFVDNAVREGGALKPTRNRSEVGQYFAFFFGAASPESHPELWRRLCADFGPGRKARGAFPEVHPANAFIGNVLRLELLSRWGLSRQAVEESAGYLLYMAEKTGTLWENDSTVASCNHGFAAHAAHLLYRDALGLRRVDPVGRRVVLRFVDLGLDWCRGTVPVPGGVVNIEWRRKEGAVRYRADVPAGCAVEIENPEGLELVLE